MGGLDTCVESETTGGLLKRLSSCQGTGKEHESWRDNRLDTLAPHGRVWSQIGSTYGQPGMDYSKRLEKTLDLDLDILC